jgi:hypothetical protein
MEPSVILEGLRHLLCVDGGNCDVNSGILKADNKVAYLGPCDIMSLLPKNSHIKEGAPQCLL